MFTALALVGNDETARRLTPLLRRWPGESAHARAVTGLEILAAIGSDVALMHLNGIAEKLKFKGLQNKAREMIEQIAADRELTPAQLADRLVPDLGLDERGSLALDFGPRQFTVSFDEMLRPFVRDADGVRLKDLPKPNSKDDADLATAASDTWKALKKDAKAIANLQVIRLEQAMVLQRRWTTEEFQQLFVEHPLTRHLTQRLVWGVYDDAEKLTAAFRVAEDLSLLDAADEDFALPADARIGIAHVLDLPESLQADFGQLFADYAILQPFQQLGRETFALTPEEREGKEITRFATRKVENTALMGLTNRGWVRNSAQDAGWISGFHKELGPQCFINLDLDPGMVVGDLSYEPIQNLPTLSLSNGGDGWYSKEKILPLAQLSAVQASEVLRDISLLPEAP